MSGLSRPLPGSTSELARPLFTLFSRTRGARWGAVLVFITAFGMMVLHVITQSLTLSGQQRADSALGVHEASTTALPGVPLGEATPEEEIREVLSDYGAERIDVMLTISPLQGGGSAKEFSYTEVDLAGGAFPDRFSLIDGTWPTEPGQACVSPAGAEEVRPGTTLGFYFGCSPAHRQLCGPRQIRPRRCVAVRGTGWMGSGSGHHRQGTGATVERNRNTDSLVEWR